MAPAVLQIRTTFVRIRIQIRIQLRIQLRILSLKHLNSFKFFFLSLTSNVESVLLEFRSFGFIQNLLVILQKYIFNILYFFYV